MTIPRILLVVTLATAPQIAAQSPDGGETGTPDAGTKSRRAPGSPGQITVPTKPPAAPAWRLNTFHKYLWLQKDTKLGETSFRFQKSPRGASGDYLLTTRRRLEGQGRTQASEGTLRFRADGRTVSYREETSYQFASKRAFKGIQELRVRFESGQANLSFVNNGKLDLASKQEVKIEPDKKVFLFGAVCQEQWNLFTPHLDPKKKTVVPVLYTEMAKILELEFSPREGSEKLRISGEDVSAKRFRFTSGVQRWEGDIWVDAKGRLLQFVSGELKIVLTSRPE